MTEKDRSRSIGGSSDVKIDTKSCLQASLTLLFVPIFLHIKDEYASIVPVLSFFTVYYDYRKYNHRGALTKNSVQIATSYSYGKNNDKYNPNWIAGEFGRQAADELDQTLKKMEEQSSAQAKKIVKLVGLIFLILMTRADG